MTAQDEAERAVLKWWGTLSDTLREDLLWALGVCGCEQTPFAAWESLMVYHQHVEDMLAGRVKPSLGDGLSEADWRVLQPVLADPNPKPSTVS